MKIMRTFTNIWNVSRSLYVNVGQFSFKVSFTFAGFAVLTFIFMTTIGKYIPLFGLDNPITRYIAIPFGLAYIMDKKTFDDKKPYSFLKTMVVFWLKPKNTYMGKEISFKKHKLIGNVTTVTTASAKEKQKSVETNEMY